MKRRRRRQVRRWTIEFKDTTNEGHVRWRTWSARWSFRETVQLMTVEGYMWGELRMRYMLPDGTTLAMRGGR